MDHGRKVAAGRRGGDAAGGGGVDDDHDENDEILVSPAKATGPMRKALCELRRALLCPLCGSVFQSPMTGPCGHSFCRQCIDAYSCNHFECPVEGCGLPLSMSSRGKSFRLLNPSLETAVTSYESIVRSLREADDRWWEAVDPDTYRLPSDGKCLHELMEEEDMDDDDDDSEDEEEEEMIDLADLPLPGRPSYGSSGTASSRDEDDFL